MTVRLKSIVAIAIGVSALTFAMIAGAGCHRYYKGHHVKIHAMKKVSPVAYCTTGSGTNISMPAYSCCQLFKVVTTKHNHHKYVREWSNQWVGGGCANADPGAIRSTRCNVNSPVYGTNMPIVGQCQFSYTTKSY